MVELTYLGTGGGRVVTMLQKRATGGFVFKTEEHQIHVDPGPGAIVRAKQYKINPNKTDIIVLSHCHTDHTNDVPVIIEAMTAGARQRKGTIFANKTCVFGDENFSPAISKYHKGVVKKIGIMMPLDEVQIDDIKIAAFKTQHGDPNSLGYIFTLNDLRVGYVSDSGYFRSMSHDLKDIDILLINLLRPDDERYPGHMCTEDAIKLVQEIKPKLVIVQHFGFKVLSAGPEAQAKKIENATKIRTIAAKDGLKLNLNAELKQKQLHQFT